MIDIKTNFVIKHREDVIDTLKVRAREKRVLYILLIIFALTMAYENSAAIFAFLLNDNFEIASLGEKKAATIKPEIFRGLEKSLQPLIDEYPQYARRLQLDAATLRTLIAKPVSPDTHEASMNTCRELLARFYEFAKHPVVTKGPKLVEFEKELLAVARLLKIKPDRELSFQKLDFGKTTAEAFENKHRNLFEFN